jgi:hypothetical protein
VAIPPSIEVDPDKNPLRIARAVEALRADYERQGYVTDDQVVRAVHKRGIGAEGYLRVRQALSEAGIVIEGSGSEPELDPGEKVSQTSNDDTVRRYLVEIGKFRHAETRRSPCQWPFRQHPRIVQRSASRNLLIIFF